MWGSTCPFYTLLASTSARTNGCIHRSPAGTCEVAAMLCRDISAPGMWTASSVSFAGRWGEGSSGGRGAVGGGAHQPLRVPFGEAQAIPTLPPVDSPFFGSAISCLTSACLFVVSSGVTPHPSAPVPCPFLSLSIPPLPSPISISSPLFCSFWAVPPPFSLVSIRLSLVSSPF